MNLINLIKNCIKQKTVSRTSGTIISYDDETGFALVSLRDYNNEEKKFLNKTGEILQPEDEVWIHYWTNLNAGYIALRNGKPRLPAGGGSGGTTGTGIITPQVRLERQITFEEYESEKGGG